MSRKKPSKNAMFSYVLGLAIFIISLGSYAWTGKDVSVLYGLIGLTLLFVVGVQRDLYGE